MPGSPFFFGDQLPADAGTPGDLLRQKFAGFFGAPQDTAAGPNAGLQALAMFAPQLVGQVPGSPQASAIPAPTAPSSNVPTNTPAPDVGQAPGMSQIPRQLPWSPQFGQPQRPPLTTPTGQIAPGATKAQALATLLKSGLMGALAGRAANEQMTAMSWGRRSGGAGVGFEAGLEQPLTLATQQQQFQRGGLENQLLQNQVNFAPQLNQLNMAAKFAEIQKNISDAQKNRYVTPRSGGVYDVQSGQFAPGTEPQDKLSTMQGLLADAASKAQAAGRDPKQDATVQQYSDIITGLQRDVQPKTQNDFQQYYAKYLSDNNLPDTAANMQKAHQMFEVKPVQPGAGDARLDRSYQFNSTQLEKVRQPVDAVATRLGNLEASLNQGTPQADALIAPELLSIMAGGSGSGLRMNEAEINRIVGGRSNWQSLQAAVNKWQLDPKAANSITPAQRSQIRSLYQVVASKVAAKQQALSQAEGALVDANDPTTHRRIVSQLRQTLTGIDAGGGGGQIQVQDPNGGIHTFPDQASAARFKQLAGIP